MEPVFIFLLTDSLGRDRTKPSTATTYSSLKSLIASWASGNSPGSDVIYNSKTVKQSVKKIHNFIYRKKLKISEYLDNAGVVSEIKKGKTTMDPVESDPATKTDPRTHILIRQITTISCTRDPTERVRERGYGGGSFRGNGRRRRLKSGSRNRGKGSGSTVPWKRFWN